jgi:D-sedoheptulose 7-phosphate isomerase
VAARAESVESHITRIFNESVAAKLRFLEENRDALASVVDRITGALRAGNKVLLFGNGGSAADAQHIAAEFTNRMMMERPALAAVALTTDTSALTSIANDYGYDNVFARQVAALGQPGDVAIAISTSGNSPSVLSALAACAERKIVTIGLTGGNGGQMARRVDHLLNVSASSETARIQETHIVIGHSICELVERKLFGNLERGNGPGTPSGNGDRAKRVRVALARRARRR